MWRRDPRVPDAERRWALLATLGSTVLFWLILCRWRPWDLFARGGFTTNFYDAQADAFWRLQLDVPADVAGIEGFLIDGKTYLYYGPFLAVARLPLAPFGGWSEGRLTGLSMLIAFACLCTVTFHLARRVARLDGAPAGAPWRPALVVSVVALSPALALAGGVNVYHETELWALVLILATFVALLDVFHEPSARSLTLAGGAALATVLTRASVGFGALTALGITGAWLVWHHRRRLGIGALATSAGGAVAYVGINLAKFGTPLDLPADRQVLTLLDPGRAEWFAENGGSFFGLRYLPTTTLQYLRPDTIRFERLLPFVRFGPPGHEFGSPLESNTPTGSLTATATLLVLMTAFGAVVLVRRHRWRLTGLMAGAAVAALPTLAIGFLANRYLVDLLPLLVVPAALAGVSWHVGQPRARWRPAAIVGVVALLAWGAVVNTALAVWLDGVARPGFTAVRYGFDERIFGGAPPGVTDISRDAEGALVVPRDGIVGIDGDCDGLYVASQGDWVPLELADGVRSLQVTFDPSAGFGSLSAENGDAISIVVGQDGSSLETTVHSADGTETRQTIDWPVEGPVVVEVTSDPVGGGLLGGLTVLVDGQPALRVFEAPELTTMTAWGGFTIAPQEGSTTPICNDISAR
ncbi:MAG: hypothetical protein QNM02_01705 [Acidimicrobiia bacterium]|nr:hypothetical protein [Acidimicrobiia bacterium]